MAAIFKYFTEEKHAFALIKKGELLLRPLSYFRSQEDEGIRGDRRDGVLSYAPKEGLRLNMEDGTVRVLDGGSFNSSVQQDDIFVYCASNRRSAELAEKFGSICVEIDPDCIIARLKARAHPSSLLDYEQIVSGNVDYRALDKVPGADWALPEKLILIKPGAFAWQDEFRIAVGRRNALAVENVALTLHTGQGAIGEPPAQDRLVLRIGKLAELATLHRL